MKIFLLKMSQYFLKPFRNFGENINVKVNLSNYTTKTNTSSFARKKHLPNLKTEVHKLDIGKLAPVSVDLSKLSDVLNIDVKK